MIESVIASLREYLSTGKKTDLNTAHDLCAALLEPMDESAVQAGPLIQACAEMRSLPTEETLRLLEKIGEV